MGVHRVAVLALDGVTPMDLAIPAQIFHQRPQTPYEVSICALSATVTTSTGFTMLAAADLAHLRTADTVIVPGFEPLRRLPDSVLDALVQAHDQGRRVVSICTGAFALAAAGVLNGLEATTHWKHIDDLERDYPAIVVRRDVLYVDQGDVLTSAGVCCGIDLCLHIVRRDLGAGVANDIARGLVAAPHRDGGQAQYVPTTPAVADGATLSDTREWALRRLGEPLALRVLAHHAGLSQRTFIRRFTQETGTTPLQWLLHARITRARELLETSEYPIERIAHDCGLGTAANLRLHFRRALGTTPTAYRRTFRSSTPPEMSDEVV